MNKLIKGLSVCLKFVNFFTIFFILFIGICLSWPRGSLALVPPANTISASIFPSASPLSKKYKEAIQNDESNLLNAGYDFNDINILYVAFDQRDEAWTTAEMILKGIQTGKINSKNLRNYFTDEVKTKFSSSSGLSLVINKIKSFGNKAFLSTNYAKGTTPDHMIIAKKKGQTKVNITIIKTINSEKQEITIALTADYPYKKWLVTGIFVFPSLHIKGSSMSAPTA